MTPTPPLAIAEDVLKRPGKSISLLERDMLAHEVVRLTAALEAAEKNQRTPGTVEVCRGCVRHLSDILDDEDDCEGLFTIEGQYIRPCPIRTAIAAEGDAHG